MIGERGEGVSGCGVGGKGRMDGNAAEMMVGKDGWKSVWEWRRWSWWSG